MNLQVRMYQQFYLLFVFSFMVQVVPTVQDRAKDEVTTFCYNSNFEGFRLNATVLKTIVVSQRIDCIMECATDLCCRSINYKTTTTFKNESNCEMLHDVVYTTSETPLERNSSYDYVYLANPQKEYNASCYQNRLKEIVKVKFMESYILSSEPAELTQMLSDWLPHKGNWSICWKATMDGWESSVFHSKCDGNIPTLTVVKVVKNNKTYVFGGYATESWKATGHNWVSAPGSFMFSLRNHDDLPPFKAPLIDENDVTVIYQSMSHGPNFAYDLEIANNAGLNEFSKANLGGTFQPPSGYIFGTDKTQSLLAGSYRFTPAEVEVLYLN